mmetsp:Transcript_23509/g.52204  ORF Transcript_23509/g.52204 Transcript_23509/m.52204 type:complete len:241 (-) Transcript_23509:1784-2506(-)
MFLKLYVHSSSSKSSNPSKSSSCQAAAGAGVLVATAPTRDCSRFAAEERGAGAEREAGDGAARLLLIPTAGVVFLALLPDEGDANLGAAAMPMDAKKSTSCVGVLLPPRDRAEPVPVAGEGVEGEVSAPALIEAPAPALLAAPLRTGGWDWDWGLSCGAGSALTAGLLLSLSGLGLSCAGCVCAGAGTGAGDTTSSLDSHSSQSSAPLAPPSRSSLLSSSYPRPCSLSLTALLVVPRLFP